MRHCIRLLSIAAALFASTAFAGTPVPFTLQIYASSPNFDFGNVDVGSSKPLTIGLLAPSSNVAQSVTVNSIVQSSGDFLVSGNCKDAVLAPLGTCNLVETFAPSAAGLRSATVTVTCQPTVVLLAGVASFACDGLPYTINLFGIGGIIAAVPALDPALVALLAAALLVTSMLFVSRRQRGRSARSH